MECLYAYCRDNAFEEIRISLDNTAWFDSPSMVEMNPDSLIIPMLMSAKNLIYLYFHNSKGYISIQTAETHPEKEQQAMYASLKKQRENNASLIEEQVWAFNRPASYRSGAKVGKPDHRNRILEALSSSFKLTKPISLLGSLEISKQASAWSRKKMVSRKIEGKHAPQVVTPGKLSYIFEFE